MRMPGRKCVALWSRFGTFDRHHSRLGFRSAPLMDATLQFIVLKREDRWVVKANDLERFFPVQREAVDAAIRLANDSGKEGNPGVVLLQKSKSDYEKIWTYGENPYPPARSDLPEMSGSPEPRRLSDTLG